MKIMTQDLGGSWISYFIKRGQINLAGVGETEHDAIFDLLKREEQLINRKK